MYSICIAVASFAVLAEPVVAQEANTTSPLSYPSLVFQGDGNQTCPSEELQERATNAVKNAIRSLLRDSVAPFQQGYMYFCGGSAGWKRIAYLDMSDLPSGVPLCGRKLPLHSGYVGEDPRLVAVRESLTCLVVNGMTECVGGSLAIR